MNNTQKHVYKIIIIGLLSVYSLLCWGSFAKNLIIDKSISINPLSLIETINSSWHSTMFKSGTFSWIDNLYTYFCTGDVQTNQVVMGDENWLFYISSGDSDSLGDYEGTNSFSDEERTAISDNLDELGASLSSKGIDYSILIVPNKENIYFDMMPKRYHHSEESRTDNLSEFLSGQGYPVINMKDTFIHQKESLQLYYKYDSHWNQIAANIATNAVLESWGYKCSEIHSDMFLCSPHGKDSLRFGAENDLSNMIGLDSILPPDTDYVLMNSLSIDWDEYKSEQVDGYSHFYNKNAPIKESIFLIGDSARSAMIPSLASEFRDVYVCHISLDYADFIDEINPDKILFEYVERYSYRLSNLSAK